jgi:hypothetical protein
MKTGNNSRDVPLMFAFSGSANLRALPKIWGFAGADGARYLTENWGIPTSPRTLAKQACVGGGPPFRKPGRLPLYADENLDQYAREKIGLRVRSTSQVTLSDEAKRRRMVSVDQAAELKNIPPDTFKRNDSHLIRKVSKRRRGVRLGDV